MSTMERLLRLTAHGDFALQLHVLPGKLLKHAVDCSRKRVEFVRPAARCDAAREITFDDRGRSAADFFPLGKKRAMTEPPDDSTQHHNDDHGAGNPVPEALDKRLEADALTAHQEVVSARQHYMRGNDPHGRSAAQAYHQSVCSGSVGDFGWPCGQIAGEPSFRRVCEYHNFVAGQASHL